MNRAYKVARLNLAKSFLFGVGTSISSYAFLSWTTKKYTEKKEFKFFDFIQNELNPTSWYWVSSDHNPPKHPPLENLLRKIKTTWNRLQTYEKTILSIVAANCFIFIGWQIPALYGFMNRHFLHSPMTNVPYSILTSTFSHQSLAHLGFNMIAFYSFGISVHQDLGQKNFIWLYLTAAMASSLASHLWKIFLSFKNRPNLLYIPSLGASGAVYALLGFVAHSHPEMKVGLIFLPGISIPAPIAIGALTIFDLYSLLFRPFSSPFDHAAHLSGLLFGFAYSKL